MASVSTNKTTGDRTLQFMLAGKRKSIWLGTMPKRDVTTWKHHVEELVTAKMQNGRAPYEETSRWIMGLDVSLHRKLVKVGLAEPREEEKLAAIVTLGAFVNGYISERDNVKEGTAIMYDQVRGCLVDYFGADKPLDKITSGDAEDWRRYLTRPKKEGGKGLGENTARRRCGIAKQFFAAAIDHEHITRNPFAKMAKLAVGAKSKCFVTREDADEILKACPHAQWRLLFALSRFGGLRCPSEHLALRWGGIDWERGRITVRSPKTKHHEGKAMRVMPLFPELRPYLQAALDELLADFDPKLQRLSEQPVITMRRHRKTNYRQQLERIALKAGVKPWPAAFNSLRSTRETELMECYPSHVVCAWMGHTQAVASKHYLQVTDDHFAAAAAEPTGTLQIPMQSVADRTGQSGTGKTVVLAGLGKNDMCSTFASASVVREGFEPPTKGL